MILLILIDTDKYKCNNVFINNRSRGITSVSINTMILDVIQRCHPKMSSKDVIQSKLATLRDMNNSGNIDCVKMDVILDNFL